MAGESGVRDIQMDADNLYLEDVITDMAAGSIRRLTPIAKDGSADPSRPIIFMGQAQVLSAMGPLPLTFPLEAPDLAGAIDLFPAAAEEAVRKMTSLPATAFGFSDRGLVRAGLVADLVVFDPERVQDHATFTEPHQYATGFDLVMVNGEPVVEDDRVTGALPGRPVLGPGTD